MPVNKIAKEIKDLKRMYKVYVKSAELALDEKDQQQFLNFANESEVILARIKSLESQI